MADAKTSTADPPTAAPSPAAATRRRRKLAAIMMADVSGFSRMMGQDEEGAVGLVKEFPEQVRHVEV